MSYLPLVIITSRILVAFLGTDGHSFHPLQFLKSFKDWDYILVSTIFGNGRKIKSRHTKLPSTADAITVLVVVVQFFGADHQFCFGMN